MIEYMLDTNICIYMIRNKSDKVLRHIERLRPQQICISFITLAELEYGVYKSIYPDKAQSALEQFLAGIEVLPMTAEIAKEYGILRSDLERKGTPIDPNDLFIAAHAKTVGVTLISNNIKEFSIVSGLKLENWA